METYIGNLTPGKTSNYNFNALPGQDHIIRFGIPSNGAMAYQNLNIGLDRLARNVDLEVYYDRNGNGRLDPGFDPLFGSSRAAGTADENLNLRITTPGNYLAKVSGIGLTQVAPYDFTISNTGVLPSNLLSGETVIGPLTTQPRLLSQELLHTADAADLFQFSMTTAGNFNAALTGLRSGTDVAMRLIQDKNSNGRVDNGEVIAQNNAAGNNGESINVRSLAAGSYFVQTSLVGGTIAPYSLQLSNTGVAPSNLLANAPSYNNLGRPVSWSGGLTAQGNAAEVFSFTMAETGNFNASLNRSGSSTLRLISDRNGNGVVDAGEVVFTSTKSGGTEALNLYNLAKGSYYIQAAIQDGATASYSALISNSGSAPSDILVPEASLGTLQSKPIQRQDSFGATDAADAFRFELGQAGNVNVALRGLTAGASGGLRIVRDGNNNGYLDSGDSTYAEYGTGLGDRALNTRLQAGQYFVQAFTRNGVASSYKLQLSTTANAPSNLLPAEISVGRLNGPTQQYGVLEVTNTADTYKFSLGNQRKVTLTLGDLNANADLRLIRDANRNGIVDAGEEIKRAASLGNITETLSHTLAAGDYFAQVYNPGIEATAYTLSVV